MQKFDGVTALPNPQPQKGQIPPPQGQYSQPKGSYPQQYPAKYPQPQQPGYPPQKPLQQAYPQKYPAPYPGQVNQQPAGFPNRQAQPSHVVYNQGGNLPINDVQRQINQGGISPLNDIQRQILAQQPNKDMDTSGKMLLVKYSIFIVALSFIITYTFPNRTNYQILLSAYQRIAGRSFKASSDVFSLNTCHAFLSDIIAVPLYLFIFGVFNLLAMGVCLKGLTWCKFIQAFCAIIYAGTAVFAAQQECDGQKTLISMFGDDSIPYNAWPFYAGMTIASLLACFLNWSWENKRKAESDKRKIALIMAAA